MRQLALVATKSIAVPGGASPSAGCRTDNTLRPFLILGARCCLLPLILICKNPEWNLSLLHLITGGVEHFAADANAVVTYGVKRPALLR